MRTLKFLILLVILITAGASTYLYLGFYNVGADVPHYSFTEKFIGFVKHRSIKARAFKIEVPENLNSTSRLLSGAGNYDAMCVHCHLAPGMGNSEIRKGLYPQPPDLTEHVHDPAEEFWIIKHGIKMTGMPAWRKGGVDDETIWDMVSFLQELPKLSEAEYQSLVEASEGHQHAGMNEDHHDKSAETPDKVPHQHEQTEGGDSDSSEADSTADENSDDGSEMKTITTRPDSAPEDDTTDGHEH